MYIDGKGTFCSHYRGYDIKQNNGIKSWNVVGNVRYVVHRLSRITTKKKHPCTTKQFVDIKDKNLHTLIAKKRNK